MLNATLICKIYNRIRKHQSNYIKTIIRLIVEQSPRLGTIQHCYKPRSSLNKTSSVIGWFLVTCPWLRMIQMYPDRVSIAQSPPAMIATWLFKGKSKYIAKHLTYGP